MLRLEGDHTYLTEMVVRFSTWRHVLRLWVRPDANFDTVSEAKAYLKAMRFGQESQVLNWIVRLEGINSAELVKRKTGVGICIHKDWP